MVVVVMIDTGLQGGIDLTVLQDMECAQGQRIGMISAARQRAPAVKTKQSTRQGEAKPGGGAGFPFSKWIILRSFVLLLFCGISFDKQTKLRKYFFGSRETPPRM